MTLILLDSSDSESASHVVMRVRQGDARREHRLRDLIFDHPGTMPVHELDPSYGQLFTVAKELNVPGVGFIDVLLADATGRLVVVECKLWRNPQARREVVGQILDYARELSRYSYEDLQRQISIATRRQGNVLYAMTQAAGTALDEAQFVDRVSRDLAAGRFLLLVVGDGITEGTQRIGEYLRDQPGLAFEFGLIEMAEYRFKDAAGTERQIIQPRVLAQTAVIERHVIRSEVPGVTIDAVAVAPERSSRPATAPSDASQAWGGFVEHFVAETRFDDPGQPAPRRGGTGWIRIPLPGPYYVNAYRSVADGGVGVGVRFPGPEGQTLFAELQGDREEIAGEFRARDLPAPHWIDGEAPLIKLTTPSPLPWDDSRQAEQRAWLGQVANQFVNSFRPRLQRLL